MPLRKTKETLFGNPVWVWDEMEKYFPDKAFLLIPPEIHQKMLEQQEMQTQADEFMAAWKRGFR